MDNIKFLNRKINKNIQTQVPKHPNCFLGKYIICLIILGEITSEFAWNDACSARPGSPVAADG
jgi:hypothetical protein